MGEQCKEEEAFIIRKKHQQKVFYLSFYLLSFVTILNIKFLIMTFKILIIDDDLIARKILSNLLSSLFSEIEIFTAKYAIDGLKKIIKYKPNLVLLDIEMPSGTGFELLESIENKHFEVIFVSAHNELINKAQEIGVPCFVTKPINRNQLYKTVLKKINNFKTETHTLSKVLNGINLNSIIRAKASGSYSEIYLENKSKKIISWNLSKLQKELPSDLFFRAHRSHLINLDHIIDYKLIGESYVKMFCGEKIPLRKNRRNEFKNIVRR